jgi:hypothetical protein
MCDYRSQKDGEGGPGTLILFFGHLALEAHSATFPSEGAKDFDEGIVGVTHTRIRVAHATGNDQVAVFSYGLVSRFMEEGRFPTAGLPGDKHHLPLPSTCHFEVMRYSRQLPFSSDEGELAAF